MINCSSAPFTHHHLMISVFADVHQILLFWSVWLFLFSLMRMLKHTRLMKLSCSAAGTPICIVVHCTVVLLFEERDCFPNMMLLC